jgi:hypothetical protein
LFEKGLLGQRLALYLSFAVRLFVRHDSTLLKLIMEVSFGGTSSLSPIESSSAKVRHS